MEEQVARTDLPKPPGLTLLQALRVSTHPERFFEGCKERRGDPFCVVLPGAGHVYLTGCPEGAREIFTAPPDTFDPVLPNPVEPMLGAGSLILLGGARHRRERKLLTPPFQGERMRAYGDVIQRAVLEEIAGWREGRVVLAQRLTQSLTLKVIVRAIFGIRDSARQAQFTAAIEAVNERYSPMLALVPAMRRSFGGLGPWSAFQRARAVFDQLLQEEIDDRRSRDSAGLEDILSLLLNLRFEDGGALSDDELKDELRTMLIAGHETTATGLAWALYYAHQILQIRDRMRGELAGGDEAPEPAKLMEHPYLAAVCSEALRRHPVVPIVLRRVRQPFVLRGYAIPEGSCVAVALTLLHTHEATWEQPHVFNPEHFMERKYSPFEYAPYGGGARRCLGAAFAAYEMKVILGTLMSRVRMELEVLRRPEAVLHSLTMGPKEPIRLVYRGHR